MKLAYILGRYPSTSETFIAREVEELRRQGFEIVLFALEAGEGAHPIPRSAWDKVSRRLASDEAAHWGAVGRKLAAHPALEGVQHIHAGWANELAYIAWAAAEERDLPWSLFGHARDLWVEAGDLRAKLAAAKFAAACTRAGEKLLHSQGESAKILYAPHGLELGNYKWRAWQPREAVQLLGVGRLVEKKGWNLLLQILPLLAQAGNVRLKLIGEGPLLKSLQKQAGLLKISNRVEFAGAMPHEGVIQAMRAADCLVLPSLRAADGDRDGLANVLLEAAALGLPLVTTDAGSASDFVDETTGVLARAGDPADLLRAISTVFAEPEATAARCLTARQRVETDVEVGKNVAVLGEAFKCMEPQVDPTEWIVRS
jgi:glycosyltransferase involved in cell wall biosynthesis